MKEKKGVLFLFFLLMTSQVFAVQNDEEINRKLRGAVIMGRTAEVKELIDGGADVNKKFDLGASRDITPLFVLCAMGNANQVEIGKLLIDAGADVMEEFQGMTLLHITAGFAGDEAVTELLIENGLDVRAKTDSKSPAEIRGVTPLHIAAGKGKVEMSEVLIKHGADLNVSDSYYEFTPLHLASKEGKNDMVELLISKGAEVNAESKRGETPLDLAVSKGHEETAEILREHGGISAK